MPLNFPPIDFDHVEYWATRQLRNRKRWDEQPEAGFLFADPRARNGLGHRKFPVSPYMWQVCDSPFVPLMQATKFSSVFESFKRDAPPTASIRALYLRNEGYAPPEEIEQEYMSRASVGGSVPPISQLEGAREVRMLTVCDCTGRFWTAQMIRGKEQEDLIILHDDMDGEPQLVGNVADVMQALMDKFLLDT